jgi:tetraacyldisaccharide-1-P 4'-kinase
VCGIARPAGFLQRLAELRCDVAESFVLDDHQPIDDAVAKAVADRAADGRAQIVVITAKDFARMGAVPPAWKMLTVVRPRVAMLVDPADAVIDRVTRAVIAARSGVRPA